MVRTHGNTPRPNCQRLFARSPLCLGSQVPRLDPFFTSELHAEVVEEAAAHIPQVARTVKNPNPLFTLSQLLAQHLQRNEIALGDNGRTLLAAQRIENVRRGELLRHHTLQRQFPVTRKKRK